MEKTVLLLTSPESDAPPITWEVLWAPLPFAAVHAARAAGYGLSVVLSQDADLPSPPEDCRVVKICGAEEISGIMKSLAAEFPLSRVVTLPWNLPLASAETLKALSGGEKIAMPPEERFPVTDRKSLAAANTALAKRTAARHLEAGVDIPFPDSVYISPAVKLSPDCRILPGCILKGDTAVGTGSEIGPNTTLDSCKIGEYTTVKSSLLTDSVVGSHCTLGPYMQLRPGCVLGDFVKLGDFVELKSARIGNHTSVAHLTYLGDCDVGEKCNFGCGVVTANYDGRQKYRTSIGDRAFIGCNTNLVPPVTVGEGAYTAAGVTVTKDVPPGALALGRAAQKNKLGWADENVGFKK